MDKEILQYIKSVTEDNATHSKGEFWNIYNDKTVASWGWTEPLKYKDYRIVWLSFSPQKKGQPGGVLFDYITDKEYQEGLAKDLDLV